MSKLLVYTYNYILLIVFQFAISGKFKTLYEKKSRAVIQPQLHFLCVLFHLSQILGNFITPAHLNILGWIKDVTSGRTVEIGKLCYLSEKRVIETIFPPIFFCRTPKTIITCC